MCGPQEVGGATWAYDKHVAWAANEKKKRAEQGVEREKLPLIFAAAASSIHVMRLLWAASASASLFVYCVTSDLVRPEP